MTNILHIDGDGFADRLATNVVDGEAPMFSPLYEVRKNGFSNMMLISCRDLPFRITSQPHRVWAHGIFVTISDDQANAVRAIVAERIASGHVPTVNR